MSQANRPPSTGHTGPPTSLWKPHTAGRPIKRLITRDLLIALQTRISPTEMIPVHNQLTNLYELTNRDAGKLETINPTLQFGTPELQQQATDALLTTIDETIAANLRAVLDNLPSDTQNTLVIAIIHLRQHYDPTMIAPTPLRVVELLNPKKHLVKEAQWDTNGDFDALDSAITAYAQRLTSQNLTMPEQFLVGVIYQWLHEFASVYPKIRAAFNFVQEHITRGAAGSTDSPTTAASYTKIDMLLKASPTSSTTSATVPPSPARRAPHARPTKPRRTPSASTATSPKTQTSSSATPNGSKMGHRGPSPPPSHRAHRSPSHASRRSSPPPATSTSTTFRTSTTISPRRPNSPVSPSRTSYDARFARTFPIPPPIPPLHSPPPPTLPHTPPPSMPPPPLPLP